MDKKFIEWKTKLNTIMLGYAENGNIYRIDGCCICSELFGMTGFDFVPIDPKRAETFALTGKWIFDIS